ncbi:MAG: deoxyribose-phosphate aldolase [Anaerovibrio sp.]|uniref:deoxyribose-phosphate aldolase n=1 Tax=Anaerovibrio sp. TaxID=1872532 RepID=UPI0025DEFE78|nr:deoxyribose-phosphate aldolase [Anaerovibrio sp.]MCR5176548.1 deoxyribose-phosphate aldolase [Anaerovibrio sp.]
MKGFEILEKVDHTLLKAGATWEEIQQLCREAINCKTASVCIPASYVAPVSKAYGNQLKICTVIGFPLGYDTTETKIKAAQQAIKDGAQEVDMVINITDAKNGYFDKITSEIASIKEAIGTNILKVIVEACYLDETEKIRLCQCVTDGHADFIKTSTGFGTGGATHEDIILFSKHIGPNVKIKAAGGIRTIEDMKQYVSEGCSRIGASAAVGLLKDHKNDDF